MSTTGLLPLTSVVVVMVRRRTLAGVQDIELLAEYLQLRIAFEKISNKLSMRLACTPSGPLGMT